ncbi:hypothetical protein BC936DRAFT_142501 [Jimgerdemannia flammicorona]|uniref:Swi5-dependent recombination DNA repair protein 1 homolog n=1 Tax=Jimgerdemannia flammicorona TaxID=994334 RepID=A0A433DF23_9FUNG|nr:hypothetical protein BC936DRAFT_142501 [Jimgerdemannia flammicorona]
MDPATPPPPKRIRLHPPVTPSPTLRKPFKSPLNFSRPPRTPESPVRFSPTPTLSLSSPGATPSRPPRLTKSRFKTPVKARPSEAEDPEVHRLKERRKMLERECAIVEERIRKAREFELDGLKCKEEGTTEALISKWRRVAQMQDRPVPTFASTSALSSTDWGYDGRSNWGWDNAATKPFDGGEGEVEEGGPAQQAMTMELMLRGMGVDLGLVGWNVEEEAFVE